MIQQSPGRGSAPATILRIGCSLARDEKRLRRLCQHVAACRARGASVAIVHGGGSDDLDRDPLRGSSAGATQAIVAAPGLGSRADLAVAGWVSTRVIAALAGCGIPAVALSGLALGGGDPRGASLGATWEPFEGRVLASAVQAHVGAGEVIVLAVSAAGSSDPTPRSADALARAVARELSATGLDLVVGPKQVRTAEGERVPRLSERRARELLAHGRLLAETAPAVRAAADAVEAGLARARIGNLRSLSRDEATVVERGARPSPQ